MFNWLCSCQPKEKTVLQEYAPLKFTDVSKIHPKNNQEMCIGRATPAETLAKIQKQLERLKPRNQLELKTNTNEEISIQKLAKATSVDSVFRKIKKSNYQQILKECEKKNQKWTDPDFDYTKDQIIFKGQKDPIFRDWKRITDLIPDATFMKHPIKPIAVIQGLINNCYWISAISVLAQRQYRIKSLFGSLETNKYGVYMCRLLFNGVYQEVVVDDFFPINATKRIACAKPFGTDIWPLIIEKCWAKLFRSYRITEFGYNDEALWALTASPVLGSYNTAYFRNDTTRRNRFFDFLMYHDEMNHIITCTGAIQIANEQSPPGKHSYAILGIFKFKSKTQDGQIRLLQIRDPLGRHGLTGIAPNLAYKLDDSFWKQITPEDRSWLQTWKMDSARGEGIFYVQWLDFLRQFSQVAIAQIEDNANYLYDTVKIDAAVPQYVSITKSSKGPFHLIVALQSNRGKTSSRGRILYSFIRVLVAGITYDFKNEVVYEYAASKSLIDDQSYTNYLAVDLSSLHAGTYYARIALTKTAQDIRPYQDVTIGYYGPDKFSVKLLSNIDDPDFLCRTLLNRAKSLPETQRKPLKNAQGWYVIENIRQSNFCYVAFHVDCKSQYDKYLISFDENDFAIKHKMHLFFDGYWPWETSLQQLINKGEEAVFPYFYDHWIQDPEKYPTAKDERALPTPRFEPYIKP